MTVRPSAPTPLSKTEKRAAAKVAKAKARRAARRRRILNIAGAVTAVVVVLAVAVVLIWRSIDAQAPDASSTAEGTPTPTAAATTAAPFPQLPDGADPALATKPEVKAGIGAVSALTKTTIVEGTGPATQTGQTITVNYVGVTYADGKEFDSSWKGGQAFTFQLGGQVIQGWNDGLVGVKVGTRIQLDIPANLAYGDTPTGNSPAGALRFVIDVLGAQ